MIEIAPADRATPGQNLRQAAEALLARYSRAPVAETESALAMLTLWALDGVEGGTLTAADVDAVFTLLDIEIGENADGPELSEDASQLLVQGMTLHDWGTQFAADPAHMRALACGILKAAH